ncbi:MAG: HAMP domain-containing sensor histidine kinase [Coriobacteriia bacterium]|nr:HAMP domain-containing sensor histidine kinase [Coriobacteriia bacterium]
MSGKPLALLVKLTVSPGYESDLGRVLVSSIDITGRKGIEAELARYRDSLEELVERRTAQLQSVHNELIEALGARDRLMANVSHEMRTPLNSIIGFTGIVLQGLTGDIGAETRTQLEMVDRSGRQLLAMVDDLLEFANVSVKGVHVEERETDLAALLHTTCEMVRELAKEKGLVIRCGHMQPPAVHTDAVRVQQVVLNLLGNAIKFTESGWIGMECAMRDDTVRISVSDTGPGIPVESRERIFEAFHQLTPARGAKHSGTGLGLAIAREVTSALGGRLSVAARTGGGSIFTLALPIDPQSRECADGEPDSATASPEDDSPAR